MDISLFSLFPFSSFDDIKNMPFSKLSLHRTSMYGYNYCNKRRKTCQDTYDKTNELHRFVRQRKNHDKSSFCDDDLSVLKELSVLMDRYRVERNQDITYAAFHSPLELLSEVERGTRLDIIFLDVLMPGQDGISAAREIRKYDTSVKIIYLTSSSEYAVDSYEVGAYFYQLKPIWQESFYRLMDSVLRECRKNEKNSLIL